MENTNATMETMLDTAAQMQPQQPAPQQVQQPEMNIGGMNDQQFEKLNEMLKRGAKVDMRY